MKPASQPEFVDFYLPFGGKLDPDNRWVKLAALMPTTAAFGHGGPPVTDDVAAKLAALS